jgi:hypothetical protein
MAEVFGAFTRHARPEGRGSGEVRGLLVALVQGASGPAETGDHALDRSHSNYNGAQVTGVEKREIKIPIP